MEHAITSVTVAEISLTQQVHTAQYVDSIRRGSQPSPWVGPGKPNLPLGLRGKAGGGAKRLGGGLE